MEKIAALLFEPVGCLAEFRPDGFDQAAHELFGATVDASASGSQAFWRLVDLIGRRPQLASSPQLEAFEIAAVEQSDVYEDVRPSLEKLRTSGVQIHLATSLSRQALARFVARFDLAELLSGQVARDDAQGVGTGPLRHALEQAGLEPRHCIYLADTGFSLDIAKRVGVNGLLMINDYDEGRALAECNPMGGVVSLTELSDALQLIEQRAGLRSTQRMPGRPYELFEPG